MKPFVVFAIAFVVAGCQTTEPEVTPYNTPPTLKIDQALADTGVAIQQSMEVLARSRNFIAHEAITDEQAESIKSQLTYIPPGLDEPITLNQRLPADKIVNLIAFMTNYQMVVDNAPSHMPSYSVKAFARPAHDVLRAMGESFGERLTIKVVPFSHSQQNDGYNGIIHLEFPSL